jgi:hypothetical protein
MIFKGIGGDLRMKKRTVGFGMFAVGMAVVVGGGMLHGIRTTFWDEKEERHHA